jgi:acyl-CoA thioester hydrolase
VPHTHACALRWADMDMLGHVNNVRYLDYVATAREQLFAGLPAGLAPVSSHRVEFVSPLVHRREPVLVDSWVTAVADDHLALAHEVYDDLPEGRRVYLRVASTLAHAPEDRERARAEAVRGPLHQWRPVAQGRRPARATYDVHVRRSDLGQHGLVRDVILFEYLQEARIQYLTDLHPGGGAAWSQHVVARSDLRYHHPLTLREEPYAVHSWVDHVGTASFTVRSEVRDGDRLLADGTVVMVCFDRESQRPAPMAPDQRRLLALELISPGRPVA